MTPSAPAGMCFVAGTLVLTEEGLRPIEEIQVGDLVWAQSEGTAELKLQPVVTLFRTPEQEVLHLRLVDGNGVSEDIGVTREHPFWVAGEGWVGAGRLRAGDELLSATGQTLWVESVEPTEGRQTVYNLEVASAHTYFVGESQAWVHNTCKANVGGNAPTDRLFPDLEDAELDQAFSQASSRSRILVSPREHAARSLSSGTAQRWTKTIQLCL